MKKKISQITNNKGAELLATLGGDEPVKGYAPSTPEQRANWNKLLRFVYERGLSGSKDLDRKDQSLGYKILDEYNKLNPKNQVPKEFIQIAQYENDLIRRKGAFPKLGEDESATIYEFLPPMYKSKDAVVPADADHGPAAQARILLGVQQIESIVGLGQHVLRGNGPLLRHARPAVAVADDVQTLRDGGDSLGLDGQQLVFRQAN